MTDQPNVDTSGVDGATSPSASKSPVEGAEQLSGLVRSVVKEVMAEELKPIKGDISGLYSRQDKDRNANREFMDEYRKQMANGLSDKDAEDAAHNALNQREAQAEEKRMLAEVYAKVVGKPSTQPAGNGVSGADARARLIDDLKIDANSPDVLRLLADEPDVVKFAAKLGEIKGRAGQHAPDPANAPALQGTSSRGDKSPEQLMKEYREEVKGLRGNILAVSEVQKKYRKLGLML